MSYFSERWLNLTPQLFSFGLLLVLFVVCGSFLMMRRPADVACDSLDVSASGLMDGAELEYLGNQWAEDRKKGHARNVWDLQAFEGKVYLGGGSTTLNAGPIHVWAYNPVKEGFDLEYTVPEEAIELYRVFDGKLYIPAADPIAGDSHKFYRKASGVWEQVSGGPELAHLRDLYWHEGKLVGVGNSRQPKKSSGAIVSLTVSLRLTLITRQQKWELYLISIPE